MRTELRVTDASCAHCKATIEKAVSSVTGVTEARLDLESGRLSVEHGTDLDPSVLHQAVLDAGYAPARLSQRARRDSNPRPSD